MPQPRSATVDVAGDARRVDLIAPAELGTSTLAVLRARGVTARIVASPADVATTDDPLAWALAAPPTAAAAVEIAARCARAATAGRPVCLLVPPVRGSGRPAIERAAALAHLRAHGAAIAHDVDAWLEAIVLLVRFGLPAGPRTAVIAPAGSWLEAQALTIANEAEVIGARSPLSTPDDPTDVVLYDPALGPPPRLPGNALVVPVAPRAELADSATPHLTGARSALAAIAVLGRAAERIAVGLGPAPIAATAELAVDRDRLDRQLAKLAGARLGDHETKVLLAAYGVPITRQAVATTPSAAVKLARRAGFPVEIKPWGHDLPSEPAGCPVERDVTSDALVRQAFTTVLARANKTEPGSAVIIRATPPPGREVSVTFLQLPALGWTVVLDAPGARLAAAPAPLRLIDAQALAAHVIASRAGDPEPDRDGLANVLRRASHLVVDIAIIATLELPRVIVGGRGARTIVVDASATLRG